MSKVSPFMKSNNNSSVKAHNGARTVADHKQSSSVVSTETSDFFGVGSAEAIPPLRKRMMSETEQNLIKSKPDNTNDSAQAQKLKISVNGDEKFSLSVSGLNHRLICHFTEMVCVLGKRQFIESMLLHLDNQLLNYICEGTRFVSNLIIRISTITWEEHHTSMCCWEMCRYRSFSQERSCSTVQ